MEQNTNRYEFYICNNPKIYWWLNSIDKPSETQFVNIINGSNWIKTNTPNFINAFTCEFVVDKKDYYNYAKLVDTRTGKKSYWFFNALTKTLRDAFLYELKMDVFVSYGYEFLRQVKEQRLNIFINRSNCNSLLNSSYVNNQVDELLPEFTGFYPLKLRNRRFGLDSTWWIKEYKQYKNGVAVGNSNILLLEYDALEQNGITGALSTTNTWQLKFNPNNCDMNVYCDVYAFGGDNMLFIPINNVILGTSNSIGEQNITNGAISNTVINPEWSLKLRNHKTLINKYKGCYCIPFFDVLATLCQGTFTYYHITQDENKNKYSYALTGGFLFPISSANEILSQSMRLLNREHKIVNNVLTRFNKDSTIVNKYVLSKFTQMLNNERWCSYFNDDLKFMIDYDFAYIAGFKFYTSTRFDIDKNNSITYSAGETLPIAIDEYQKYIASTLSTRNTNLEIQNRDNGINVGKSILGALTNVAGGAIDGFSKAGVGGAIAGVSGGVLDSGFSIGSAINKYNDYQKKYVSQLEDVARSSSSSLTLSTNEKSNLYNKLNKISKFRDGENVVNNDWWNTTLWLNGYNELDYKSIKASNQIIWKNGYKINISVNSSEIDGVSQYLDMYRGGTYPFLYWDWQFDDNYFKNIYPTLDKELIDAIKLSVNGMVRFWSLDKPNYNVELDITK